MTQHPLGEYSQETEKILVSERADVRRAQLRKQLKRGNRFAFKFVVENIRTRNIRERFTSRARTGYFRKMPLRVNVPEGLSKIEFIE